jgi:hypothetical protein
MSVEPASHEFAGLEGTELAVNSDFVVEASHDDGLRLKATVQIVHGRLECRKLELSTEHGQVDGASLDELRLATVLEQAASHIARCLREPASDQ